MAECKNIDDMQIIAQELIFLILTKGILIKSDREIKINFQESIPTIKAYLLDAYNEGYDAAIVSGKHRVWRE